jgi:hypothetical protein
MTKIKFSSKMGSIEIIYFSYPIISMWLLNLDIETKKIKDSKHEIHDTYNRTIY